MPEKSHLKAIGQLENKLLRISQAQDSPRYSVHFSAPLRVLIVIMICFSYLGGSFASLGA